MKTSLVKLLPVALFATLSLASPSFGGGKDDGHHHDHGAQSASPAGQPGDPAKARKVIAVKMFEMRIKPSEFRVKSGQTVKFSVTNAGAIRHEFGIGTQEEQKAHAEMMLADPTMKHEDGSVITVEPGETKELVWRFGKPGVYEAACQVPGHYPAGMLARIVVTR